MTSFTGCARGCTRCRPYRGRGDNNTFRGLTPTAIACRPYQGFHTPHFSAGLCHGLHRPRVGRTTIGSYSPCAWCSGPPPTPVGGGTDRTEDLARAINVNSPSLLAVLNHSARFSDIWIVAGSRGTVFIFLPLFFCLPLRDPGRKEDRKREAEKYGIRGSVVYSLGSGRRTGR